MTDADTKADVNGLRKKLSAIDERAFQLAVERWRRGSPLEPADRDEAERAQKDLREIARELRGSRPDLYEQFSETISEALLDLKYALTAPQAVSLRLNQYMDANRR